MLPVGRPGPKAWGGPPWRAVGGAYSGPVASAGGIVLGWTLGLAVGAAGPVNRTWPLGVTLWLLLAAPLVALWRWRGRRRPPATAGRPAKVPRGERPERSAGLRGVAVRALGGSTGRLPAVPNTPRALLLHGEAALPQATGALLQVLAQVLSPCRVGLFHHDAGGQLVMRASRATAGLDVGAAVDGKPALAAGAGVAAGVEREAPGWPEPVLQRLREAAARRQAGPLPADEALTALWAAPILEAPQEPGAGHLWGLLAVLRPAPQAWSHADVALLEGVAGQLALAWGLEQALRISRRHLQRLERIATTDGLTELVNQRHFRKLFDLQLARARRYNRRLSLIFLDIDHFKEVNDTHGHQAGDEVLKKVAEVLRDTARCTDTVARLGGEEFAVLMEETGAKGAERYAERIRQALGRELFTAAGGDFRKTCSLGIATFPEHGAQAKELMAHADQALYFAKRTGRNRTVIYRADATGRESHP